MMWMYDHAAPISWAEYRHWMTHALPFGWAILSEPRDDHAET
jgi:hypothetical protein